MKKFFTKKVVNSFTRNKTSRTAAKASAESSASVADVSQSAHSAATSHNLRELSARLDDYLDQIELDGGDVEVDVISMSRQIEKVERYLNGWLPDSVQETSISDEQASLIRLAAWASKEVYAANAAQIERLAQPEEFSYYYPTEHTAKIEASIRDGTVKATRIHLFDSQIENSPSRLLVVAIRGSTSLRRDWMINFDDIAKGTDGEGFINVDDQQYQVHGGFLECAQAMVDKVSTEIRAILTAAPTVIGGSTQILFAGHSAGGAVASLLYAHMTSQNKSKLTELSPEFSSMHCVVFGAPPVTKPSLTARKADSIFYSIINEGDPVPRIDKDYAESLLKIFISPMPVKPVYWELPGMLLDNAGTILFLKNGAVGFCRVAEDEDDDQQKVKVVMETTIFGNPRAHKMDLYLWELGIVGGML